MIPRAAAALIIAITTPASADLFKCVGKDGKVAYQAEPCADATQERRIKAPFDLWTRPLVAVRDRNGRVVRQSEAEVDLSGLRMALDKLVR